LHKSLSGIYASYKPMQTTDPSLHGSLYALLSQLEVNSITMKNQEHWNTKVYWDYWCVANGL